MPAEWARPLRCAIYTRKSTEHGLDQEFNSLDAQREACEAYIKSQASQGWRLLPQHYDDPAYSGGNLDRPALKKLLADITVGKVDVVVSGLLDVFLAIPAVILALTLVVILRTDPSAPGSGGVDPTVALILALGLVSVPVLGRITRASTLTWSEREFVLAARLLDIPVPMIYGPTADERM